MDSWHDDMDEEEGEEELRDFTFGGKDAVLFLIDASPNMLKKNICEEGSPFEMALKCVHATLKTKVFATPNDVLGVLIFGARIKEGVRDFENLHLFLPFDIAEGKSILKIEDYLADLPEKFENTIGSSNDFKLHEALWQSQSLFNEISGKTSSKKIILLTCDDDPHASNDHLKKQAIKKGSDLYDSGIGLEIIPVGNPAFDLSKFYIDLMPDFDSSTFMPQKYEDLVSVVRKRIHKKRSLGRVRFQLGGGIEIAISTYSFVQRAYKPSKKKLTRDTNEEVTAQRQFVNFLTGAPLLPSDINKYQEYGGKQIKFSLDEVKSLTSMGVTPGLKLIAFKDRSELRWHHFVRQLHFIYPDENAIKGSRNLFSALLLRCIARNVVPICSFKPRDASQATFVALVPHVEKGIDGEPDVPKGFLVFYLPFHDDIRNIPDLQFVKSGEQQIDLGRKLISKLKLKKYEPEAFENPDLQSHYRLIEGLALEQEDHEMPEDFTMPPLERMDKKLGTLAADFKMMFLPEPVNNGNPATKKPKLDESHLNDVADMVRNKTVDQLKVDQLKLIAKSLGVAITGKKKAELVEAIYANF